MMKFYILFWTFVLTFALTNTSMAGIQGSSHDFSQRSWNRTGEVCIVCHTPHWGEWGTGRHIPLWNHHTTQAVFTPYRSATMDATVHSPDGISLACLSCHDGTVAVDAYGQQAGFEYMQNNIGTDLSNDHPISFVYDTALSTLDGHLHDPASTSSGLGGTIQRDLLRDNKVQCISCHDVHNQYNQENFLVKSNAGSALCLTCHNT